MRRAEVVTGLGLPSVLVFQKTLRMMCMFGNVLALIAVVGCKGMPTLEEQERLVKENNLVLDHVTTRAVVNVWGEPPHYRSQFTHFFVMSDQRMIPSMRVVAGETPRGWSAEVHAGEGLFFAYPDRGWLLVFLAEHLVYKEELKAEELRTIVKTWAYEDRFKTRLEGAPGR
ncbi:MAG: hypothetical protein HP490_12470 [Nitrospira sp.]|nr:hypothetical protein [Nitrospira sp.]